MGSTLIGVPAKVLLLTDLDQKETKKTFSGNDAINNCGWAWLPGPGLR